jgi:hypothetical protein
VNLFLLRRLRYSVPLTTIFDFHDRCTPSWANEEAEIVARLDNGDVTADLLGGAPLNPGLSVVDYASCIGEVIDWIDNPDNASVLLVTSNLFGPDVMARCRLSPLTTVTPRTVLLMGQSKSYTTGNKASLDATTVADSLTSLHRDHWFKKEVCHFCFHHCLDLIKILRQKPHLRQKLVDAIEKYDVLRFVGGYPLPPDLTLKAASVQDAIERLGTNVALASLKYDEFRGHFISEGEMRILVPMDAALDLKRHHKRKASEIDN